MVNQCANSACSNQLHYLRDGKVFLFSRKNPSMNDSQLPQRLEHFWLCGTCTKKWTLSMDGDNNVQLVETKRRRFRANYELAPAVRAS